MHVKQMAIVCSLGLATAFSGAAMAADEHNVISAGAAYTHMDDKGIDGLDVDHKVGPSIDYRYFFTKDWAIDVDASEARHTFDFGSNGLGTARVIPLRVTGQYYFDTGTPVRPFIGAGLNYTRIDSVRFNDATIENHGTGGDLIAGAMFDLGSNVRLTAQVEQLYLKTKLASSGDSLGDAKLNPVVGSVLVGYAF